MTRSWFLVEAHQRAYWSVVGQSLGDVMPLRVRRRDRRIKDSVMRVEDAARSGDRVRLLDALAIVQAHTYSRPAYKMMNARARELTLAAEPEFFTQLDDFRRALRSLEVAGASSASLAAIRAEIAADEPVEHYDTQALERQVPELYAQWDEQADPAARGRVADRIHTVMSLLAEAEAATTIDVQAEMALERHELTIATVENRLDGPWADSLQLQITGRLTELDRQSIESALASLRTRLEAAVAAGDEARIRAQRLNRPLSPAALRGDPTEAGHNESRPGLAQRDPELAPATITNGPASQSVADQVDLGAQLRWLTHLHDLNAPAEQIQAAVEPLRRRREQAEAALAARLTEHDSLARKAVDAMHHAVAGTSRDTAAGDEVRARTQQRLAADAETEAQAENVLGFGHNAEDAALAEPVTNQHLAAAATAEIRTQLIEIAAAQRTLRHLRDSHAETVRDATAAYLEYRDWPVGTPSGQIHLTADTARVRGLDEYRATLAPEELEAIASAVSSRLADHTVTQIYQELESAAGSAMLVDDQLIEAGYDEIAVERVAVDGLDVDEDGGWEIWVRLAGVSDRAEYWDVVSTEQLAAIRERGQVEVWDRTTGGRWRPPADLLGPGRGGADTAGPLPGPPSSREGRSRPESRGPDLAQAAYGPALERWNLLPDGQAPLDADADRPGLEHSGWAIADDETSDPDDGPDHKEVM